MEAFTKAGDLVLDVICLLRAAALKAGAPAHDSAEIEEKKGCESHETRSCSRPRAIAHHNP
jgi:hypothetical protein